jgi:hypothetical protein
LYHNVLRKHGYKYAGGERSSILGEAPKPPSLSPEAMRKEAKIAEQQKAEHKLVNEFYDSPGPKDYDAFNKKLREHRSKMDWPPHLQIGTPEYKAQHPDKPEIGKVGPRYNRYEAPGKPDVEINVEPKSHKGNRISHETVEPGYHEIGYYGKGPRSLNKNIVSTANRMAGGEAPEDHPLSKALSSPKVVKALTSKSKFPKKDTIN